MNAKGLTFKYYTKQHQRSGKKFEKIERRKKRISENIDVYDIQNSFIASGHHNKIFLQLFSLKRKRYKFYFFLCFLDFSH